MSRWLAAATAGVSLVVAAGCATDPGGRVAEDPAGSAAPTSPSSEPVPSASPVEASPVEARPDDRVDVPVYFVRHTPMGLRLIAEWRSVLATDRLLEATRLLADDPADPDYHSLWPNGLMAGAVHFDGADAEGVLQVVFGDGTDLGRPAGLGDAEADLAVQQLVRTLQGAAQARARVTVSVGDDPVRSLLGVDVAEPLQPGPDLEELALMNVASPHEGDVVDDGTLRASGWNNGFEGTVWWRVLDGKKVLKEDALIGGWLGESLFPWKTEIDVSDLPPGEYTFVAGNDDPTGGTEGMGTSEDTKTFVIR